MTLLVALQDEVPRRHEEVAALGVGRWIYVGGDAGRRIRLARGPFAAIEPIELGAAIQEEAARLRRPYIDWVGSLARANDSAEWWASELAARNSYTMLFSNVCALAAARRVLAAENGPVLAVCGTPALAEELRELAGARRCEPASAAPPS